MIAEEQLLNQMMQADELASLMARNGGKVLDHVDSQEVVQYASLRERLQEVDLVQDTTFQEALITTYHLSGRRVSNSWKELVFQLMQDNKENDAFDFQEGYFKLYGEPTSTKLGPTQFSVLTKIANLLHDRYPVYEPVVGDLLGFKKPTSTKDSSHDRMREYMNFYDHLQDVHKGLIDHEKVQDLLKVFKIQHRAHLAHIPVTKRVDFLIRSTAGLQSKGKLV